MLGKCERLIGTVSVIVHKMMQQTGLHWPAVIPATQLAINTKVAEAGHNPFVLMLARHMNVFMPYTNAERLGKPLPRDLETLQRHHEYLTRQVFPIVARQTVEVERRRSELFNARHLTNSDRLPVGAIVMLKAAVRGSKNNPPFEGTPHKIVFVTPSDGYVLMDRSGGTTPAISRDRLKPIPLARPPPDEQKHYGISAILDHRITDGLSHYLIKWEGVDEPDTWEPVTNMDSPRMVREFWQRQQTGSKFRRLHGPPSDVPPPSQLNHLAPPTRPQQQHQPSVAIVAIAPMMPAAALSAPAMSPAHVASPPARPAPAIDVLTSSVPMPAARLPASRPAAPKRKPVLPRAPSPPPASTTLSAGLSSLFPAAPPSPAIDSISSPVHSAAPRPTGRLRQAAHRFDESGHSSL